MATRTITGTLKHVDGSAWASASVIFRLMEEFQTATETYPRETHTETTDATGYFSITLAVPTTGSALYEIQLPDNKTYLFYLESGAPTTLESLLLLTHSGVTQNAVQDLIDANNILTITEVDDTYTVVDTDEWIRCDGTFTVTLPPATGSGQGFLIMNVGTGTITVDGDGTDTINGGLIQEILSLNSLFVVDVASNEWDGR
jgi:hypothetical protein